MIEESNPTNGKLYETRYIKTHYNSFNDYN